MKTLKHALSHKQPGVSKLKALWIWFWYNDATRLAFPLLGLHLIVTVLVVGSLGLNQNLSSEVMRHGLILQYLVVFAWAMLDNDYENLKKVGLSVDRKPLLSSTKHTLDKQATKEIGA